MSKIIDFAVAAGGGRFTPDRPNLSYLGSGITNLGQFNITNYNSSFIYNITGGTRSDSIITVTGGTGSATISARSPKGFVDSPVITAFRQAPTQYFVETVPFRCYECGSPPCCAPGCCGCGTCYYDSNNFAGKPGCFACCACGYFAYTNYSGSGYAWSGANYTNGQGEWWKIV